MSDNKLSLEEFLAIGNPSPLSSEPASTGSGLDTSLNISGNPIDGPAPGPDSGESVYNTLSDAVLSSRQWAQDPFAYARPTMYDASHLGANFERFYSHDLYDKLGFHPYRDNESLYNAESSWWQDFKRMSKVYPSLFGTMFTSPYDFGSENSSKALEHAMATAGSGKDGLGGFFIDLGLQSAITLGIASELIAENFAIAGLTALSGGTLGPAAFAKALHTNAMGVKRISDLSKAYKGMNAFMKELRSVDRAKDLYQSVNASKTLKSTFDFVNPFTRSTKYATDLIQGGNSLKGLSDFAKTRKAFGAFYRDLREINLVAAESLMEGNLARDENHRKAIDDFYEKNKRMPNPEEAEKIYEKSKNVAFGVSMINSPVIYFTNKLVFDDLLRGFKAPSLIGEEMVRGSRRTLSKTGQKVGDKVYDTLEKTTARKVRERLLGSSYLPWSRKYISANLGEGFQEFSQEATAVGVQNYYDGLYKDPLAGGLYHMLSSTGVGLDSQFSMQGLEVFASGFLMGSLVKGVGGLATSPKLIPSYYKNFQNKDLVEKQREKYKADEDRTVEAVNNILSDPINNINKIIDHSLRVKRATSQMRQSQREGDQKGYQDSKDEQLAEHMYLLVSQGRTDLLTDHLNGVNQLSDEDFADAFGLQKNQVPRARGRLADSITKIDHFKHKYELWNEKYSNPFVEQLRSRDEETRAAAVSSTMAFEEIRKEAIMSEHLMERAISRGESIMNDLVQDPVFAEMNGKDITALMDSEILDNEIATLENEIKAYKEGDSKLQTEAIKKQKTLELLKDWKIFRENYTKSLRTARASAAEQARDEALFKSGMGEYTMGSVIIYRGDKQIYEVVSSSGDSVVIMDNEGTTRKVKKSRVSPVKGEAKKALKIAEKEAEQLYKIFKKYISDRAGSKSYSNEKSDEAFIKIRDKFSLEEEANMLFNRVNFLADPQNFLRQIKIGMHDRIKTTKLQDLRDGLKQHTVQYKASDYFQKLEKMKLVLDPETVEEVLGNRNAAGAVFIDINSFDPITEEDTRHAKAMKATEEFIDNMDPIESVESEPVAEGTELSSAEAKSLKQQEAPSATIALLEREYNRLMVIVKDENKKRRKNKEAELNEDLSDQATVEFLYELSQGRAILDGIEKLYEPVKKSKKDNLEEQAKEATKSTEDDVPIGESSKVAPKELEPIKQIWENPLVLDDDRKYYENEDGTEQYERASTLSTNPNRTVTLDGHFKMLIGAYRGGIQDALFRDYINGDIDIELSSSDKPNSATKAKFKARIKQVKAHLQNEAAIQGNRYFDVKLTDSALDQLIVIIHDSVKSLRDAGYTLYADIPSLKGTLNGYNYAGTQDILAVKYDESIKKDRYYIIDIKGTTSNVGSRYSKSGKQFYAKKDRLQQNTYRELFKQSTNGEEISGLFILSVLSEHDTSSDKTKSDDTVPLDQEPKPAPMIIAYQTIKGFKQDTFNDEVIVPVDMSKDIYELDAAKLTGYQYLSKKAGPATEKTTPEEVDTITDEAETLSDEEFEELVVHIRKEIANITQRGELIAFEREILDKIAVNPDYFKDQGIDIKTIQDLIKARKTELAEEVKPENLAVGDRVYFQGKSSKESWSRGIVKITYIDQDKKMIHVESTKKNPKTKKVEKRRVKFENTTKFFMNKIMPKVDEKTKEKSDKSVATPEALEVAAVTSMVSNAEKAKKDNLENEAIDFLEDCV